MCFSTSPLLLYRFGVRWPGSSGLVQVLATHHSRCPVSHASNRASSDELNGHLETDAESDLATLWMNGPDKPP
jgi:hypothetical protein